MVGVGAGVAALIAGATIVSVVDSVGVSRLDTMLVAESRGERLYAANQSRTIIDRGDWEGRGVSAADMIAEQAGVQTRKYGAAGSFQSVSLRGISGERIRVYLDDVALNSARGGAVNLGIVPLEILDEIAVYKGAIPARYGGSGMGGVIHLKTVRTGEPRLHAGTMYGSWTSVGQSVTASLPVTEDLSWLTVASGRYSRNDFPFLDRNGTQARTDDDSIRIRDNADYTSFAAIHRLSRSSPRRPALSGTVTLQTHDKGLPGDEENLQPTARNGRSRTGLTLTWEDRMPEGALSLLGLTLDGTYTVAQTEWSSLDNMGLIPFPRGRAGWRGTTVSLLCRADSEIGEMLLCQGALRCGYEGIDPFTRTTRVYDDYWESFRGSVDVNGEGTVGSGPLTFTAGAGAGAVYDSTEGGVDPMLELNLRADGALETYGTAKAAAALQVSRAVKLFVTGRRHVHVPSIVERFGTSAGMSASPDLRPEKGWSADAGTKVLVSAHRYVEAVLFYNLVNDGIVYVTDSRRFLKALNFEKSRTLGAECLVAWRFHRLFAASVAATLQDARNRSPSPSYRNKYIPNEPLLAANGTASLMPAKWAEVEYSWEVLGARYRDRNNLQKVPRRYLNHVRCALNPGGRFRLTGSIRNLFDVYYEDLYSAYPYPGREYFVEMNIRIR